MFLSSIDSERLTFWKKKKKKWFDFVSRSCLIFRLDLEEDDFRLKKKKEGKIEELR